MRTHLYDIAERAIVRFAEVCNTGIIAELASPDGSVEASLGIAPVFSNGAFNREPETTSEPVTERYERPYL